VATVGKPVIGNPPPKAVASGVSQDKIVSSASDDTACKSRNPLESNSGFLTPKVGPIQSLDLISGFTLTSITTGPNRNPFIRPHRTQKINLSTLMSATPYYPRDQP
jgi:hypothetical protein